MQGGRFTLTTALVGAHYLVTVTHHLAGVPAPCPRVIAVYRACRRRWRREGRGTARNCETHSNPIDLEFNYSAAVHTTHGITQMIRAPPSTLPLSSARPKVPVKAPTLDKCCLASASAVGSGKLSLIQSREEMGRLSANLDWRAAFQGGVPSIRIKQGGGGSRRILICFETRDRRIGPRFAIGN